MIPVTLHTYNIRYLLSTITCSNNNINTFEHLYIGLLQYSRSDWYVSLFFLTIVVEKNLHSAPIEMTTEALMGATE